MLFSPEPKTRRQDLYDFDRELSALVTALRAERLTLVTGLRRTGKTSLLRVALGEAGVTHLYVDVRLSLYAGYRDIVEVFARSLEDLLRREASLADRLREALRGLGGLEVSLGPPSVRVTFRGRGRLSLSDLFTRLNDLGEPMVVAVDEAQELRKANWLRFDRLFAYAYDSLPNVRLVLTGSQFGLLYDFLGLEDPRAPLFGRAFQEVRTRRLSPDEALDFLERGFSESGVRCPGDLMEKAVDAFDGIIGWLTYFGHLYVTGGLRDLEDVVRAASSLALEELRNLISSLRSPRYAVILRALAEGRAPWAAIRRRLEDYEGRGLNPATVSQLIGTLVKLGVVEEVNGEYAIADPVYRLAASRL